MDPALGWICKSDLHTFGLAESFLFAWSPLSVGKKTGLCGIARLQSSASWSISLFRVPHDAALSELCLSAALQLLITYFMSKHQKYTGHLNNNSVWYRELESIEKMEHQSVVPEFLNPSDQNSVNSCIYSRKSSREGDRLIDKSFNQWDVYNVI